MYSGVILFIVCYTSRVHVFITFRVVLVGILISKRNLCPKDRPRNHLVRPHLVWKGILCGRFEALLVYYIVISNGDVGGDSPPTEMTERDRMTTFKSREQLGSNIIVM